MKKNEYKANLPVLKKIHTEVLQFRESNGVKKTLAEATKIAALPFMSEEVSKHTRNTAKHLIASCNYSAALVRKELKNRAVEMIR